MRASKQRWVPVSVGRLVWWMCLFCVATLALSAQCTNPTQVPNGTYTSGDHSQVDSNALSAASFSVSQAATATFAAGNCIHLGSGFRANAVGATAATTFHAWVDIAPTALSFSPSGQTGQSQAFTWTVSSPSGNSNLSHVFALFNTTATTTANACYIHYDPRSNLLYLANDTSNQWLGGFAPGSSGNASNSQCTIAGTGASMTAAGTQVTVTVPVTFKPSFAGTKNEYLYALDNSGVTTGWKQMGGWTIPAPSFSLLANPANVSATAGVTTTVATDVTVTPLYGFASPVQFLVSPNNVCSSLTVTPELVSGPPWTARLTMSCTINQVTTVAMQVLGVYNGSVVATAPLYLNVTGASQYYLTTVVSPAGSGYISPASGSYAPGSIVPLTATPADGYVFTGFSGVDSSSGSTASVTMNGPRTVTATFSPSPQVLPPSFSPTGGTYPSAQTVALTTLTQGAFIHYTSDGTTPSSTVGTSYTVPFTVENTTMIKAVAYKSGLTTSAVTSATYIISSGSVASPTFSPPAGTYSGQQNVTLSSLTSNATIRYTTDGTNPSATNGSDYTGAIPVTTSTTLKAIAMKSGMASSSVTQAAYVIQSINSTVREYIWLGGRLIAIESK